MNSKLQLPSDCDGEREPIPLSAINQYLFCPRRAALIHLEGIFKDNEHTICGDIAHENIELAGYQVAKGVLVWRALPVWSERLGICGMCDIVEVELHTPHKNLEFECSDVKSVVKSVKPVEFKLGKRRQWANDDAQLCAQALCLEEMFGIPVSHGAIYHAKSRRRRTVEFTHELRALTEEAITKLRALWESGIVPSAQFHTRKCAECSLVEICLPELTSQPQPIICASRNLLET